MHFGDIILNCNIFKFSPDSQFYGVTESTKLYIKYSSLEAKNLAIINTNTSITQFQFSPDSKLVAVFLQKKSQVLVYKISGEVVAKIQDSQCGIVNILWARDSVQLLTFSDYMYKCSIYNLSNQATTYIRQPKIGGHKGCSFTSNGKFMALIEKHDCKDYLGIYYTVDWKLVNIFPIDMFDAVELAWAPNDSFIIVWDNFINYKLIVFDPMRGQVQKFQPYEYALGIKSVHCSSSSLFLAIGSYDQKIRLLNGLTWKLIAELDCSKNPINSNDVYIYKQDENQSMDIRKYANGFYKIPVIKQNLDKNNPVQGIGLLQFSHDDNFIACRNDNMPHSVFIWNTSKLQLHTVITLSTHIKMIKWSKKDNSLCIVPGSDRILLWRDQQIEQCRFPFENRKFIINKIKWSGDGKKLLAFDKSDLVFMEVLSRQ